MGGKRKLRIAAFFDGRPGHEKQTKGIISALQQEVDVDVVSIAVSRKPVVKQAGDWCRLLLPHKRLKNHDDLAGCSLLFGTGTHTHLPMLLLKKQLGIPAVTCMTPSLLLKRKFDLIFAPMHDKCSAASNIFRTIGPPNPNRDKGLHERNRVLILCGGVDPKSHHWDTQELLDKIDSLIKQDVTKRYIISTSPRTPEDTATSLSLLAEKHCFVEFYDFHETPAGWVELEYSRSHQVWVTGDSVSMVYEALSSGCRVGIIPVKWRRASSKFQLSETYLRDSGLVLTLEEYLLGKHQWQNAQPLNEAKRCADEILKRYL